MNFNTTQKLLDAISIYVSIENICVQSDASKDWRGRKYLSDYVEIIKEQPNTIGFEVMQKEIIVVFFTYHIHFEDYSFVLKEGDPDYIERAIEFLEKLFTLPVERKYTTKGDKITRDESFFILSNGNKESCAGVTFSSAGLKNIFKKPIKHL